MTIDRTAVESLLRFWSEAGVETLFDDASPDRLAPTAVPALQKRAPVQVVSIISSDSGPARDLAWAAKDLDALAAAIATFDGCPLKFQGARRAVCWRGEPAAPVLIVGEAPGAEEDQQGLPFVGRAGRLLNLMLEAAGLTGRVLITNTVFWRPPGNRTPTVAEQIACRPFVERLIDLVRPRFLLLVGGPATNSMLDERDGILTLRGRWFEWRAVHTDLQIPAMPTLHPAFLLRQPVAKKKAWQDLQMLVERLDRAARID